MSYVALYRKWRPDAFNEVKGQEHIVTTLKNQVTHDRVGHAYLFCGTRGTGKTTMAKLFAKAVNCTHPKADGSPCNECDICKAITTGNSMDVLEIDAASNNGVSNIREIRDSVTYTPTEGKYKVYIIDEVHMLTSEAFNALLKTLEEPPSYVIFILATTESHKIPITISSRCQKYDFRRISIETIADRMMDLLNREQVEYETAAINYIAKAADGSMRDGLSLLDQCIAFHLGEKLTYDKVLEILGAVDIEIFDKMLEHIQQENILSAVNLLDELLWQGRDLSQFVVDFTWYLRNLLLVCGSEGAIEQVDASKEHRALMLERVKASDGDVLMRYIRILSEVSASMRYASQKRVTFELALIKMCKPQMEIDTTSLLDRIRVLEKKLEEGITVVQSQPVQAPVQVQSQTTEQGNMSDEEFVESVKKEIPAATAEDIVKIYKNWRQVKQQLGPRILGMNDLYDVRINDDKTGLLIEIFDKSSLAYQYFYNDEKMQEFSDAVAEVTGVNITFTRILYDKNKVRTGIFAQSFNQSDKVTMQFENVE